MSTKKFLLIILTISILILIWLQITNEKQAVKIFVINLDRSYMRRYSITAQMYLHGMNMKRISAVNGSTYIFNHEEKKLFSGIINEHANVLSNGKKLTSKQIEQKRKNVMACALSHINIWRNNIGNGPVLTLEDDIILYPNFKNNLNTALKLIEDYDPDWHILWISSGDPGNREIIRRFDRRFIYRMDPAEYNGQGAMGYVLSNKGLEYFVRQLDEKGCFCGLDIFLLNTLDIHHAYGIYKPLIFAEFFDSTI